MSFPQPETAALAPAEDGADPARALHRRNEFLGTLSHEAGNVLMTGQMIHQLLLQAEAGRIPLAQVRQLLADHLAAVSQFVDDLQVAARLARGKFALGEKQEVDLAEIVGRAVAQARPAIERDRHELSLSLPEGPLRVCADAEALARAIAELLENAAQWSERDGRITLRVERREAEAMIRVSDSGPPIPAALRGSLFDLFVRGDSLGPGWGVGLALVRAVAEGHGGRVELAPPAGPGNEFVLWLPAA